MLINKINKLFNQIKFYTIIEPDYFMLNQVTRI